MKITKHQLRRLIREQLMKPRLQEAMYQPPPRQSYNQASAASKSMYSSIKRKFVKAYPDAEVTLDGREGWIIVNGAKAVNISSASMKPMSPEEMFSKMEETYEKSR